jgi:hypothetical protein
VASDLTGAGADDPTSIGRGSFCRHANRSATPPEIGSRQRGSAETHVPPRRLPTHCALGGSLVDRGSHIGAINHPRSEGGERVIRSGLGTASETFRDSCRSSVRRSPACSCGFLLVASVAVVDRYSSGGGRTEGAHEPKVAVQRLAHDLRTA